MTEYYVYDIETYPNVFTCVVDRFNTGEQFVFEWSERCDDIEYFKNFISFIGSANASMVGFNNIGFDYPVIHQICTQYPNYTLMDMYLFADKIIKAPRDQRFNHIIWDKDRIVRQIDLYKINHFDNLARSTSLKALEFNMRSGSIQDLPYEPGIPLRFDQIPYLIQYNKKDTAETKEFFRYCMKSVVLRDKLSNKFGKDFTNHNDTKIGKDYFIMRLEENRKGTCWDYSSSPRKPKQTIRPTIALGDIILPCVKFEHPEFKRILTWFQQRVIDETKGSIKNLNCNIDGFQFDFGTGGIHGSIPSTVIQSDVDNVIIDVDVASYYPNLAIVNHLYPEHLGEQFCKIYKDMYIQRKQHKKGTPENAMFKLALNGTYGDSNSIYSPFYDPKFTMSITINGQLLLCMLSERIMKVPGLKMIQVNTDGITFLCPRNFVDHIRSVCKWWEDVTGLELEEAAYSRMMIRDVNNYIAEYNSGKIKQKGCYVTNPEWHKDHSSLVVPKAAVDFLLNGTEPADFLRNHDDGMDFLIKAKVDKTSRLIHGKQEIQKISRYYVSNKGQPLVKIMPPLKKNPNKERSIGINVGWLTTVCNNISDFNPYTINYSYYEAEVEKLITYAR